MQPKQTIERIGYNTFYLERSGEQTLALVDKLLAVPEMPLNVADHDAALEFEAGLYTTHLGRFGTVESILRTKFVEDKDAPLFFAEAFVKNAVQVPGNDNIIPQFTTHEEVYTWLAMAAKDTAYSADDLRELSKQSEVYYKNAVVPALEAGVLPDDDDTDSMPIVLDSRKLSETIQSCDALREYLLELRTIYTPHGELLDGAKRAIVDIYLAKIDSYVADHIVYADYLLNQLRLLDNGLAAAMAMTLIPDNLRDVIEKPEAKQRLFQRLDYVRNGMGTNNGKASPISDQLFHTEEKATTQSEALFTPEEKQILRQTMVAPSTMQQLLSEILSRSGKLSAEDPHSWTAERTIRAPDQLYQVVINPARGAFALDGVSGVYKVPNIPRSLFDVMVVGGSHELKHIDQSEADMAMSKTIKLAALKGKRVAGIREAGANMTQRAAEQAWFGESKPYALTYVKALQALDAGEGLAGAVKAFFNERRALDQRGSIRDAAEEASDRVLRLERKGRKNSQALVYAEESMLKHELEGQSKEKQDRATAVTSLDLVDQLRLHQYGLLPDVTEIKNNDWSTITLEVLWPYITQALSR